MIKNLLLFGLLAVSGFLVVAGDLKLMLIGVFTGIVALDCQNGFNAQQAIKNFETLAGALGHDFEMLESRLREHINSRCDEIETRLDTLKKNHP